MDEDWIIVHEDGTTESYDPIYGLPLMKISDVAVSISQYYLTKNILQGIVNAQRQE